MLFHRVRLHLNCLLVASMEVLAPANGRREGCSVVTYAMMLHVSFLGGYHVFYLLVSARRLVAVFFGLGGRLCGTRRACDKMVTIELIDTIHGPDNLCVAELHWLSVALIGGTSAVDMRFKSVRLALTLRRLLVVRDLNWYGIDHKAISISTRLCIFDTRQVWTLGALTYARRANRISI